MTLREKLSRAIQYIVRFQVFMFWMFLSNPAGRPKAKELFSTKELLVYTLIVFTPTVLLSALSFIPKPFVFFCAMALIVSAVILWACAIAGGNYLQSFQNQSEVEQ